MKKVFFVLSITLINILLSCNSAQNDAQKQAQQIQEAVKQNTPGSIPTSADGYSMRAKINGKDWIADAMMPPQATGRITGDNNDAGIGLPYYDKRNMVAGKKIKLGEDEAVDITGNDAKGSLWATADGEMEITKVDDKWAEGTFYFTLRSMSNSDKTIKVTDGFFRILLSEK